MRGNNTLHLNEATIIEAVQEYLAKRYTPTPKVTSVDQASDYTGKTFRVAVVEEEPKP